VVSAVIADFKPIAVQLADLVPREVILLIRTERERFGDEERGAETVLFRLLVDLSAADWTAVAGSYGAR
jgi:hypothetical protein